MRNPEWSRDEVILCLEFYFRHYPNIPGVNSDEISQLSQETRQLCMKLIGDIPDSCRNNTSVHMKMRNFDHLNPEHTGKGLTNASKLNKLVFQEFANDRDRLSLLAKRIKDLAASDEPLTQDIDDDEFTIQEGLLITRTHLSRERNSKIVRKKKEQALRRDGKLTCEGCSFNFENKYGARGRGFIECHHTAPVSQIVAGMKTTLSDLSLVCSNCHRMIHRNTPWLTMSQLREIANLNY